MADIQALKLGNWFAIGDSLTKALNLLQANEKIFGPISLIQPEDLAQPVWLYALDSGLKLQFCAKYNKLCQIDVYLGQLDIILRDHQFLKMGPLDLDKVQKLMQTPTYEPRIERQYALLEYDGEGLKFLFEFEGQDLLSVNELDSRRSELRKVTIGMPWREDRLIDNKGPTAEITLGTGITLDDKSLKFGDRLIDVLRSLGNPNKEFTKDAKHFLNYLELGLDLCFVSAKLAKIILHANQLQEPNFGFYDRCWFELQLGDAKLTPHTRFSQVKDSLPGDTSKFYVNNPSAGGIYLRKTHVFGFEQCLVEVCPESDLICSITLI